MPYNKRDDTQGMYILHSIVDNNTHPARVKAAWMIANYLSTGGTFKDTVGRDNIIKAIKAYKRVIFFINLDPDYPDGNDIYEEKSQIELKTHYRLPQMYFEKFRYGAIGIHNMHKLRSPSYSGNGGLNTYPKYNPYTIDSLEQTVVLANQCLTLPFKRHFKSEQYKNTTAGCRILKEAAQTLLPLEHDRLALLNTHSCSDDLVQCDEYEEILKDEIVPIVQHVSSNLDEIFGAATVAPSRQ